MIERIEDLAYGMSLSLAWRATVMVCDDDGLALNLWLDWLLEHTSLKFMSAERQGRDPDIVRRRNLDRGGNIRTRDPRALQGCRVATPAEGSEFFGFAGYGVGLLSTRGFEE